MPNLPSRRTWDALDALERSVQRIRTRVATQLQGSGATPQQLKVLRALRDAGAAGIPTLAIARAMGDGSPGITRLVDRLERQGLVKRTRDGDDRREVRCSITDGGLTALRVADEASRGTVDDAFASLTNHELGALIHLLGRLR